MKKIIEDVDALVYWIENTIESDVTYMTASGMTRNHPVTVIKQKIKQIAKHEANPITLELIKEKDKEIKKLKEDNNKLVDENHLALRSLYLSCFFMVISLINFIASIG